MYRHRLLPSVAACLGCLLAAWSAPGQPAKAFVPYAEAKPIFEALDAALWPEALRGLTPAAIEAAWPDWIAGRDRAIRQRVAAGDEDSIVHLLTFGTSFTSQPRISEQEVAGLVVPGAAGAPVFVASPVLTARIDDFVDGVASPGGNARLRFAREVLDRRGLDPATESGRVAIRTYLEERVAVVGQAERAERLLDPDTGLVDRLTLYRDRGLSSDTTIAVDLGIERALEALHAGGLLRPGTVRRAAIVGPGLDVIDKQNGYDFYPQQTIQPFALIDSLIRLDLARAGELEVTAFDLSPRVLRHLEEARAAAEAGRPYTVVLPRNLDQPWSDALAAYWQRLGNWIGDAVVVEPPPGAGRVDVRAVSVRPPVVLSIAPADLDVVAERVEPGTGETFDLIVATNILLYYDVFEQSLAMANVARMLRPGGLLLSNNQVFELPGSPMGAVGATDVVYMSLPGVGDAGDRVVWYQRQ